jgi:hypothetical protein
VARPSGLCARKRVESPWLPEGFERAMHRPARRRIEPFDRFVERLACRRNW